MILWLTGNSDSGKTTLAKQICKTYHNWINLDGDEIRTSVSNGFKVRNNHALWNTNAATYVGIAYAEQPGKYSNSR